MDDSLKYLHVAQVTGANGEQSIDRRLLESDTRAVAPCKVEPTDQIRQDYARQLAAKEAQHGVVITKTIHDHVGDSAVFQDRPTLATPQDDSSQVRILNLKVRDSTADQLDARE
jgi:hypothetical protein